MPASRDAMRGFYRVHLAVAHVRDFNSGAGGISPMLSPRTAVLFSGGCG